MEQGNPFANLDKETQAKIQEAQMLEQGFQQVMQQKQALNYELNETDFSLKELDSSDGEVFKIVGSQVIIKSTKEKLTKEMTDKKQLIESRLKTIDEQEKEVSEKLNVLREEIMQKISGSENNEEKNSN